MNIYDAMENETGQTERKIWISVEKQMKKKFNIFLICIVFIMIAFDIVNQIHNGREYSLSNLQIGLIVIAVVVYCVMSLIVGVGIYLKKRKCCVT